MGMYDHVNVAVPCPTCGAEIGEFQSKDGDCVLELVDPASVYIFYSFCRGCGSWVEFVRDPPPPPPRPPVTERPLTREQVEALGFRMTVITKEKL